MPIRVAIIDDHPLAIAGLQNMLSSCEAITVSSTYSSGAALLKGFEQEQPDVLLLDVLLQDMKGQELAGIIRARYPIVRMLAITSLDAPIHVKSMMRNGCNGYLLKNTDVKNLICAITEVHEGKEYIEPSLKEQMLQNMLHFKRGNKTGNPTLSRREKEILQLIIEENTNQQIADKLFLSLRTIENHRFSLLQKMEVKNTVGLIKMAIQLGLYS
jgi:DNA-binding NarL/FixJ family response regulator